MACFSKVFLCGLVVATAAVGSADERTGLQQPKRKEWFGDYAKHKYAELNKKLDGQLDPIFKWLPGSMELRVEISGTLRGEEPETKLPDAYKALVIATIGDAMTGGIVESLFAKSLLESTPPQVVVDAVVPELERSPLIANVLTDEGFTAARRRMQGGPTVREVPYEPDFQYYAAYLWRNRERPMPLLLIGYMFRTSPTKALQAMLSGETGFGYPPRPAHIVEPHAAEHRRLLLADQILNDVVWHWEFKFEVAPEQLGKAKQLLQELSKHDKWWVRLYVAEIVQQHSDFQLADVLERLKSDDHELVRKAASRKTE
jgi:hypothetical protein